MLVAPPDLISAPGCLPSLASFTPAPRTTLPFPTILVASRNDHYATIDAAGHIAGEWGSTLIDAGAAGHINADSGHGPWPEGQVHLQRLMSYVRHHDAVASSFFG
jgi:predicted alpha/beta hydrolase family esterase